MINHPNRRPVRKTKTAPTIQHNHDHDYSALLISARAAFDAAMKDKPRLFLTDAEGLNVTYLDNLPGERQVHDCSACRRFIETYGGLVAITATGETIPVMWEPVGAPEFYQPAFAALHAVVKRARVIAPFLSKDVVWGQPMTGAYRHLSTPNPAPYRERALSAGQAMAAKKEDFRTVATALADYKAPALDEALRLFKADALARSDKFVAPVQWLRELQNRPKGRKGENVLWRAIADAPNGYCHPRAGVVGSLLDDIVAGLPFPDIKARFNAKLGPLIYQRPQAPPAAGNIKAAEALVEKLGIAPALDRRFARLDELETIWKPVTKAQQQSGGVFGHLKAKAMPDTVRPSALPCVTMTWEKFARTVLPEATALEQNAPGHGDYIAMLTAANPDAPPILKWDREEARNPVSWYVYHGGSAASAWRLSGGWTKVNAVSANPTLWGASPQPHLGDGVVLILDGAIDTRTGQGNALFPECLKAELHGARATIEAYSRSAVIGGREDGSACGYVLNKTKAAAHLRAFVAGAWSEYRIDRWD